jgi:hypothetical protein
MQNDKNKQRKNQTTKINDFAKQSDLDSSEAALVDNLNSSFSEICLHSVRFTIVAWDNDDDDDDDDDEDDVYFKWNW